MDFLEHSHLPASSCSFAPIMRSRASWVSLLTGLPLDWMAPPHSRMSWKTPFVSFFSGPKQISRSGEVSCGYPAFFAVAYTVAGGAQSLWGLYLSWMSPGLKSRLEALWKNGSRAEGRNMDSGYSESPTNIRETFGIKTVFSRFGSQCSVMGPAL